MKPPVDLRIVFAGTPGFSVPPLTRLVAAGFQPLAVLTQPDRPAGRGRRLQAGPVKQAASASGIPVHQPGTLRDAAFMQWLAALRPDLIVVVAYGLLLPAEILAVPRFGCWNIHASLLPRWRGAAPVARAIEAGDAETGVCIMQMDAGLDTGPVLMRRVTAIGPDETAGTLQDRLAERGAAALLEAVQALAAGSPPPPEPQPQAGVTYARKLDKAEARIDWSGDAALLARRVRAFNPWPVAWCTIGGERTRIWAARALPDPDPAPAGTVVQADAAGIVVATGRGRLVLLQLQRPGARPVSAAEYLNAGSLPPRLAAAP